MFDKQQEKPTQSEFSHKSPIENGDIVDQAAEQIAILLWNTWLHKKKTEDREKKNNYPN